MKKTLCAILTISAITFSGCASPNKSEDATDVTETAISTRTTQVTASPESSAPTSPTETSGKKKAKSKSSAQKTTRTVVKDGSTVVVTERNSGDSDDNEPTARRTGRQQPERSADKPDTTRREGGQIAPAITDDDFEAPNGDSAGTADDARSDENKQEQNSAGVTCYNENGYVFISRNNGRTGFSAQVTEGDSPEVASLGATTDSGSISYDSSVGNGDIEVTKDGSTYRFSGDAYLDGDGGGDSSIDFSATCPQ